MRDAVRSVLYRLALVAVLPACAATPSATDSTVAPSEVTKTDAPSDAGSVTPGSLPDDQSALVSEINERYREETSAAAWSERFEREGREVRDKQADVLAVLAVAPGTRVADIGAGTGLYTMPFADAVGSEGRVYAVDIQSYFLEHLRERARTEGRRNVQTVQATARSAELAPDTVDLVFLCDAYHHIEQPAPYLRSLHSALREGGRLVVIDYHRGEPEAWTYGHIRATAAEFRAEIEAAGFVFRAEHGFLAENFFYVFERN